VKHDEDELVLVDTPGFNNTGDGLSDSDIIELISKWIKERLECPYFIASLTT
jgi:hypothetical protein